MKLKFKITLLLVMLVNVCFYAQGSYTIKGTVTAKADNSPLPGVSILIVKTSKGTETDFDGNYAIQVKSGDVLQFQYLGFASQTVIINNQKTLNISLVEDTSSLDEVVVIGYGTQKKSHLTGAISKVVNESLDQIAVARVDDALIGQVSGVNIQATNAEAGAAPTITIRGFGSITANSGPAVVVDGVIVDSSFLGNLDMNDVESFEVLKDAASAAIYGSEGSNGVILITTKTGKDGDTKFSYNTFTGYKSAFGSDDYRKSVADWAAKEFAATGALSETTQYAQKIVEVTGIDRDWQDVFFDGGFITSHSLSASGGNKDTKFNTSLRYLHDEGVVITDDYKLYSAKLKVNSKLTDKLKFGLSATPSYSKRRALPTSIHNPTRQSPWLPIYHTAETLQFINRASYPDVGVGDYFYENHLVELDLDGNGSDSRPRTSGDANPYAQYVEREWFEHQTKLLGSTFLQYEILDGLTAKTSLGVTIEQRKRTRWDGTKHHSAGNSRAQYILNNRFRTRLISDNTLSYNTNIGDHDISILAGVTVQKRKNEVSQITGTGYTNDLLKNLQGATTLVSNGEFNIVQNKIGYFGRINYAFSDKYLVSASFRRDGSSVFGIDSKWGNFPAVSLGWNVTNEDFLSESETLSKLKLRVSYGLTGSENFNVGSVTVNAWPYLAQLTNTNAIINGGVTAGNSPLNIANPLLQWEASEEFNPGIDFGFLNNRITGSLDYYKRTSDKLLLNNPVSYVTGFNNGIVNLGKVANSGIELELRSKNVANENFSWNTSLIASTNKNELLDYGESDGALTQDGFGRNSEWINSVGNPISSFYGYVVDKELADEYWNSPWIPINGKSEDIIVKDLNGDGIITNADKTILGDPYPEITWSLTNDFNIGNFDFSFMIQGSQGAEVKNIGDQYFYTHWTGATTDEQAVVTAGIIPDASFLQPRIHTNDIISSAGYFSLRNVNLGFTLPDDVVSKLGMQSLRLYATGQNLLYITSDDYHGFNPEYIDSNNTPTSYGAQRAGTPLFRTISVGLNVNF
ncbi:TonB-linked SusC/RagA family outer membrane protein [Lutibacter sp. Hel_I_33_5]|uniref:SusC/RagA family TonB-linked outer membrane protein n=1 Tax=Lutibacter sp. Hel_I_33_5 TaxID=1566289 RepID=UPI00119F7BD2|nr:TonB-dependent receptor [Lutibacter sp. Hel_I_33_5]TVZ57324.1 TonB-linked SusC/RagA family outer membrane protein [Lutibacter sp. Hel_I_33_5]